MNWQLVGNISGKKGIDGRDATPIDVETLIDSIVKRIPTPKNGADGKDGAPPSTDAIQTLVSNEVEKAVTLIPAPKNGVDGKDADPEVIKAMIAEGVARELPAAVQKAIDAMLPQIIQRAAELVPKPADGRDGVNGKDAPVVDADALIETIVKRIPTPKDGMNGENGVNGRDGIDGKSATIEDIRPILEGEIAKGVLDLERRATDTLQRAVERLQQPKDGINGKDGRDGISLDDFEANVDGRVLTLGMRCGDRKVERAVNLGTQLYRGIFKSGQDYEKGDTVTYGGSQWIALNDTKTAPPGEGWRQCVAKGKDGKDLR